MSAPDAGDARDWPFGGGLRSAAIGLALWLGLALLSAVQWAATAEERGIPVHWGENLRVTGVEWLLCVPFLVPLAALVRRWPIDRERWRRHGLVLLAGTVAAAAGREALEPLAGTLHGLPLGTWPAPRRLLSDFTIFAAVVAALHGPLYHARLRARELEAARLAQRLAETQLAALRTQLQPHFLFNTLNAVVALMRAEPDTADRMLTRLAELLRTVLAPPADDEHALGEELRILEQYLEIMALRFGPRLEATVAVPTALHGARVPWLVLQPLVENALEHGGGRRRGPLHVRVTGTRDARGRLLVEVCDDGPGPAPDAAPHGTGIGLANTRRRLAQLHGDAASLTLEARPEGGACARLELPWREEAPGTVAPRAGAPAASAPAAPVGVG